MKYQEEGVIRFEIFKTELNSKRWETGFKKFSHSGKNHFKSLSNPLFIEYTGRDILNFKLWKFLKVFEITPNKKALGSHPRIVPT